MSRLIYIARKFVGGFGRLYNWFTTQEQKIVEYGYLYNWFTTQEQAVTNYGYLYTQYAAVDARNITASGWHVPNNTEFETLRDYLGGTIGSGTKMKKTGFIHWLSPNTYADNSSGFNGVGSGWRHPVAGTFYETKEKCYFWSTTVSGSNYYEPYIDASASFSVTAYTNYRQLGCSIRITKDSTTLTNGQTGTYTGNDGKLYQTICIGTQEWLSSNLMETKYRNGDVIPVVTDNSAWAALTTGARCSYNNTESNAGTTKKLAPAGWHVPTDAEYLTLNIYLGGGISGTHLKETGTAHWISQSSGTDNSSGFSGRGAGRRLPTTGTFLNLKEYLYFWSSTVPPPSNTCQWFNLYYYDGSFSSNVGADLAKKYGFSIRLIKDDSTLAQMTGNDGKLYKTVKIGTQVWLAEDLIETKYNDGSLIPEVTVDATWAALTTGARCSYNNTESNAFTTKKLTSSDDWTIPTKTLYTALFTYLGGFSPAGGKLKKTGTTYWNSPNVGATNEVGFNAVGSGIRLSDGSFIFFKTQAYITTGSFSEFEPNIATIAVQIVNSNNEAEYDGLSYFNYGSGIRLCNLSTLLTEGQTGTYIQNDGVILNTICINGVEWLSQNLSETKYRDGTLIPNVTDNSAWTLLTEGAQCSYDNLETNV